MHGKQIIGLVLISLMTACSHIPPGNSAQSKVKIQPESIPISAPQSDAQETSQLPEERRSSRSPWKAIETSLSKEKPYAEFREIAMTSGWVPVIDAACKTNVGGSAEICDRLPELVSCSGDGYCKMQWQHRQQPVKLSVVTYGDYGKWDVPNQQDALRIVSWEFTSTDQSAKTVSCPAQDFQQFLQVFASDKSVRTRFMLPEIRVNEIANTDLDSRIVMVPKEKYDDFSITYANGAFRFIDRAGNIDDAPLVVSREETPARMRLNIVERANGDYFVKYVYGISEGNSWVFQRKDGCWYLAEDPEMPSP